MSCIFAGLQVARISTSEETLTAASGRVPPVMDAEPPLELCNSTGSLRKCSRPWNILETSPGLKEILHWTLFPTGQDGEASAAG